MDNEIKREKNKKIKIAVYYIVTGDYKRLFPDFLESLQNFFPEWEKRVKLLSDGLEDYKDYVKGNVIVDLCPRINDYPWPIVALYKMYHIEKNFDFSCDYACYFNGNCIVHENAMDVFDLNKITCSFHSFNDKSGSYDPWPYINLHKDSVAYLENGTYDYLQSGFFFGRSDLLYYMCIDITNMVGWDVNSYRIAQWHDESYFNKWCVQHPDLIDKKYVMTVFENDIDPYRFVYLRDKSQCKIVRTKD